MPTRWTIVLWVIAGSGGHASDSTHVSDQCTFPSSEPNVQCWGGQHQSNASHSRDACRDRCCSIRGCVWWGIANDVAVAKVKGCWTSTRPSKCRHDRVGWSGESNGHLPFSPSPGPPLPSGPIRLDKASKAHVHDGLGAIIDASSRFLFDYPEPQRSAVLDYLFKPGFGAALDICKVEVGGDAQQTDGTTASYIHNVGEAPNFNRSHIWWAMREAKARNPGVLFYGLAWGFPGHVGGGDFYSLGTGKYLARWAQGAAQHHDLNVSVLGLWNERTPCKLDDPKNGTSWNCTMIFGLRAALDDAGLGHVRVAGTDHGVDTLPMIYDTGAPIDIVATHGYGACQLTRIRCVPTHMDTVRAPNSHEYGACTQLTPQTRIT